MGALVAPMRMSYGPCPTSEKLMGVDDVLEAAKRAKAAGSTRFCMVGAAAAAATATARYPPNALPSQPSLLNPPPLGRSCSMRA